MLHEFKYNCRKEEAVAISCYGAENNEPGIYLTFEESKKKVRDHGEQFGWDLEKLERNKN